MEMDLFILSGNEVNGSNEVNGHNKLEEFSEAKEQACKIFQEIKECLHNVNTDFTGFQERMKRPTDDDFFPRKELSKIDGAEKKINGILEILQRNYMKIVFFGRTSNGKSTVINAMLHDKILPASMGHTTTSFIEVKGSKEEKATVACDSREPQIVECLETLHKALEDLNEEKHALIEVSWPGSKCQLLREEIRLVDCPGYNDSFAMDQKLEEICQNADVFVLVINAVSSISEHDTNYFKEVSRRLSKPNLFVLFNFWDMSSDDDPGDQKKVRNHHMGRATDLLTKELQVMEKTEVTERIFFVSAKEVLRTRMDIKKEEKPGFEERLKEFEAFECKVKTCVSETAIETKFKTRAESGRDVISELRPVLEHLSTTAKNKLEEMEKELKDIEKSFKDSLVEMEDDIQTTLTNLKETVTSELEKQFDQIDNLIVRCDHSFDTENIEKYKNELDAFVKETLNDKLSKEIEKCILALNKRVNTKVLEIKNLYRKLREELIDQNLHFEGNFQSQSVETFAPDLGDDVKTDVSVTWSNVGGLVSSILRPVQGKLVSLGGAGAGASTIACGFLIRSLVVALVGSAGAGLGLIGTTYFVYRDVKKWKLGEKEKVFQQKYADYVKQHKQEFINSINSDMLQQIERKLSYRMKDLQDEVKYKLNRLVYEKRKMHDQESRQLTKRMKDFEALDVQLSNFMKEYLSESTYYKVKNFVKKYLKR